MFWVARKLWPWLVSATLVTALVFLGSRNGRLAERVKATEGKSNAQTRIRKATAGTRTDRVSVVDSLRNGRF